MTIWFHEHRLHQSFTDVERGVMHTFVGGPVLFV